MSNELSILELDAEQGELLPAREALGVLKFNVADLQALNVSAAVNFASSNSTATSSAGQFIFFSQH